MPRFTLDEGISPENELISFLEYNGIDYRREEDGIRFALAEGFCEWETFCQFRGNMILIYGIYPFCDPERETVLSQLNEVNRQLARGGMFILDGTVAMRNSADLIDVYSAYETIARALEYNAGAMVRFWQAMRPRPDDACPPQKKKERS